MNVSDAVPIGEGVCECSPGWETPESFCNCFVGEVDCGASRVEEVGTADCVCQVGDRTECRGLYESVRKGLEGAAIALEARFAAGDQEEQIVDEWRIRR